MAFGRVLVVGSEVCVLLWENGGRFGLGVPERNWESSASRRWSVVRGGGEGEVVVVVDVDGGVLGEVWLVVAMGCEGGEVVEEGLSELDHQPIIVVFLVVNKLVKELWLLRFGMGLYAEGPE